MNDELDILRGAVKDYKKFLHFEKILEYQSLEISILQNWNRIHKSKAEYKDKQCLLDKQLTYILDRKIEHATELLKTIHK